MRLPSLRKESETGSGGKAKLPLTPSRLLLTTEALPLTHARLDGLERSYRALEWGRTEYIVFETLQRKQPKQCLLLNSQVIPEPEEYK